MRNKTGKRSSTLRGIDRGAAGRVSPFVLDAAQRTISIKASRLQAPQNIYDADLAGIEHRVGDVRLFFGKLKRAVPDSLRTRIEIRYPVETFYKHFWNNSRDFHERIRAYMEQWPSTKELKRPRLSEMETDKDHSEWANFDYMAHSGTEGAIDFFHLPPGGLARFAKTGSVDDLELEAILRVQLSVGELLAFLDSCTAIAAEVESYLPPGMRKE